MEEKTTVEASTVNNNFARVTSFGTEVPPHQCLKICNEYTMRMAEEQ